MTDLTGSLLSDLIPDDWRRAIEPDLSLSDLDALASALNAEQHRILPAQALWFRALRDTPLATVRAVILGQDPYPNPRHAEGLAFSVPDGEPRPFPSGGSSPRRVASRRSPPGARPSSRGRIAAFSC